MILVTNFKTYPEATGARALKLAEIHEKARKSGKDIVIAVQSADIRKVSSLDVPVFAQHADPVEAGRNTGFITPESVRAAGASGVMLNHSEHPMKSWEVENAVNLCKMAGLKTLVFVSEISEAVDLKNYRPDYIAYEIPELIGTGKPISREKPDELRDFVKRMKGSGIKLLCGAGISKKEDVAMAKELGAEGVVVSSSIVKSKNPEKIINQLASV